MLATPPVSICSAARGCDAAFLVYVYRLGGGGGGGGGGRLSLLWKTRTRRLEEKRDARGRVF